MLCVIVQANAGVTIMVSRTVYIFYLQICIDFFFFSLTLPFFFLSYSLPRLNQTIIEPAHLLSGSQNETLLSLRSVEMEFVAEVSSFCRLLFTVQHEVNVFNF